MQNIFNRPNGKYWSKADVEALNEVGNYSDLLAIALRVLDRMPQPIVQICGPFTTGGKGSLEANAAELEKAISFFSSQGETVFDQMPFEEPIQRIKKKVEGYDTRILTDFYLPLFKSGKIKKLRFLPGWRSSKGATWEHEQAKILKINFVDLPDDWNKKGKTGKKKEKNLYAQRGVDAVKSDVHNAVKNLDKGLFPNAFCKIMQDPNDPDYCVIMHADGAGTKSSLAYLYWKETGDVSVWKGVVQDAIVMNLDDLLCVGVTNERIYLSSTVGRNQKLIPSEVVNAIINAPGEFAQLLKPFGTNIEVAGGETADVGDLVRTVILDNTVFVRVHKDRIISVNIQQGDIIVGLASFGKAVYESEYNGGMGSNGLTSARHDVFFKEYVKKYPETFDPKTKKSVIYCGKHKVTDKVPMKWFKNHMYKRPKNMGKLVLSPTRTYAPVMNKVLKRIPRKDIHGIIHCSGSAQTKVLNFIEKLAILKYNLFPTPPLFNIIQEGAGTSWKEMYQVFNMGHRFELYVKDEKTAKKIIKIAKSFNVAAQIIGYVEAAETKKVIITSEHGEFVYQ